MRAWATDKRGTRRALRAWRWLRLATPTACAGLCNRGEALVCGARAPIIGRVSMDQTILDITDIPGVRVGDVATFFNTTGRRRSTWRRFRTGHDPTRGADVDRGQGGARVSTGARFRTSRGWTERARSRRRSWPGTSTDASAQDSATRRASPVTARPTPARRPRPEAIGACRTVQAGSDPRKDPPYDLLTMRRSRTTTAPRSVLLRMSRPKPA